MNRRMHLSAPRGRALGVFLTLFVFVASPCTANDQQELLEKMRVQGLNAKLTIYPVFVLGRPNSEVANILGIILEKEGMTNLDASGKSFERQANANWDDIARQFAEHLTKHPSGSDYALYAEYLGDPKRGPSEVRWVVANSAGRVVASDRQLPSDAPFKRTAGRDPDPLGCSRLVGERIFTVLELKRNPPAPGIEGKFARLFRERSGVPSPAEFAEMKQRADALKQLKTYRVQVLPTKTGTAIDPQSAERIAKLLKQSLGIDASIATKPANIKVDPSSNQQKMLWQLARELRKHVEANPSDADYYLMADYVPRRDGKFAHGTQLVLCDKQGRWVIADIQNDQHADFKKISPQSIADCDSLTARRLERLLK